MKNANHGTIDNAQLKSIVERIEKLNEDSSCLENPRDGGAWWAAVSGVAQS